MKQRDGNVLTSTNGRTTSSQCRGMMSELHFWRNTYLCQMTYDIHGPFKRMPPELLHTSGSGLIMYMFESLPHQLWGGNDHHFINQEHIIVSNIITGQSERDYPRGSMQNRLIDGTKFQSSEPKGNLFQLMCIAHQTTARNVLKSSLNLSDGTWKKFITFLQMYLAMEEWFHDHNNKEEIRCSRDEIAKILTSLQKFFPRKDNSNGYRTQKFMVWWRCRNIWSYLGVQWIFRVARVRRHIRLL